MKVLLTGGTGFLGRHVAEALTHARVDVIATHAAPLRPEAPASVHWVQANVLDREGLRTLLLRERPTHLVHMAWRAVYGNVANAPENLDWLVASLHLARDFAEAGGQRIVGSGSCFEYDWTTGYCCEDATPLNPSTYYGACKNSLQAALSGLAATYGLSFAWPRIFFTYGPGENASRFVAALAGAMLRGAPAEMSQGVQERDFVYAGDVGRAILDMVVSTQSGAFNVATGSAVRLLDIAEEIARQTGRRDLLRVGARPPAPYEPPLIVGATRKTAEAIGWEARTSLPEGIERTLAALRDGV